MGWVADLLGMARRTPENFKAVTDAQWRMIEANTKELALLREKVEKQSERIHELEQHELNCQRSLIEKIKENSDLREQLIFLEKQKDK
jgi:hypothetical protein